MIEKITLENFKGIGEETTINLGRLTLLFGGNSSGKSTVLHALAYLREILERRNCDVHLTTLCGKNFDLGGFKSIVHRHDIHKKIQIRLDWIDTKRTKSWAKFIIGIPDTEIIPRVLSYQIGFKGLPFAELEYCIPDAGSQKFRACLRRLNVNHPAWDFGSKVFEKCLPFFEKLGIDECNVEQRTFDPRSFVYLRATKDAMPGELFDAMPDRKSGDILESLEMWHFPENNYTNEVKQVSERLTASFRSVYSTICGWLRNTVHIGPIRKIPPRNCFLLNYRGNESRWIDDSDAYNALPDLENWQWAKISEDLSGKGDKYLNTGYELVYVPSGLTFDWDGKYILPPQSCYPPQFLKYVKSLSQDDLVCFFPENEWFGLFDIKRKMLVQIHDVGVGLSQIIPLVVCMVGSKAVVQLFEQPELHLHPQQQAAVGDLLIRATKFGKQIIAETHSIHLILRVLRRIGETSRRKASNVKFTNNELKILYADSLWNGNVDFQEIAVGENGKFLQPWPDGFFEQEFKERFAIN